MKKFFTNKRVLITGNTGFKGSWLSLWMYHLGAKVMGISSGYTSQPSNFKILKLEKKITYKKIDIRNFQKTSKAILNFKPDYIFHLAAEAIVKKAYANPNYAWATNTFGTINILETLKIDNSLLRHITFDENSKLPDDLRYQISLISFIEPIENLVDYLDRIYKQQMTERFGFIDNPDTKFL